MQDNPKRVWQDQPTEKSSITLTLLRQKARELHARTRRELVTSIAMALAVIAISAPAFLQTANPWLRLFFALAIAWAIAGQFVLHRGMRPTMLPGDAGLITGLEFYRQQIKQQGSLLGRILRWSIGPLILSIGSLVLLLTRIATNRGLSGWQVLPFTTVFVTWIVAVFVLRRRRRRELQREIDELTTNNAHP